MGASRLKPLTIKEIEKITAIPPTWTPRGTDGFWCDGDATVVGRVMEYLLIATES